MRQVICDDAIRWLKRQNSQSLANIVCSIPDASEVGMAMSAYIKWFPSIVRLLCQKLSAKGYVILVQTDRKHDGETFSKSSSAITAAHRAGLKLMWHKTALLSQPGHVTNMGFTPGYCHVLCFCRKPKPGRASPDVLPEQKRTWKNGMPLAAAALAVAFIASQNKSKRQNCCIYVPFCGIGTVLAVADKHKIQSIGIEINPERCKQATAFKPRILQ